MNIDSIDLLYESALILAAVCFSLAAFVLARGVTNKLHIHYFALASVVSIWAMSFFIAGILDWRAFETIHITATLLLPSTALFFVDRLVRPEGIFFLWLKRLAIAFPVVLVPLVIFGYDRYSFIRDPSFFSPGLIFLGCLYLFLSEVFFGGVVTKRMDESEEITQRAMSLRTRNLWLYFGGAFVTFISVMDRVEWIGRTVPAIGNFFMVIYFYFLKDVVLQQHYTSFRRLLSQVFANGVTAFILSLVIVYITVLVDDPALYFFNSFLAAFVMVFSVDSIRKLAHILFQRLFYRESSQIHRDVEKASAKIAEASHIRSIVGITEEFCKASLDKPVMSFYVLDADSMDFKKQHDNTVLQKLPMQLPVTFPLVDHWKKARRWKPISKKELEDQRANVTSQSEIAVIDLAIEALRSLNSNLAFPFRRSDSVLGFVTLNIESLEEFWSTSLSNLPLYEPFFQRAANALHELDIFEKLRERDRLVAMGEMAAGLAHEIRNPLGAIKGAAQMLEHDNEVSAPNKQFLDIIIEETNRLNAVVSEFLNYSKPFSGKKHWEQLEEICEKAIKKFRDKYPAIQLHQEIPAGLPDVYCHGELILQVLINFLQNAVHAIEKAQTSPGASLQRTDMGLILLTVAVKSGDRANEIAISVKDTGRGMSAEEIDKIFIPFYTASGKGTGMGLPICLRIAEAHEGRIEVDSKQGSGTTMTLRFRSAQPSL